MSKIMYWRQISFLTIAFLISVAYLHFTADQASAQMATLSLSPSSGTFNRGCKLTVNINLDTGNAPTDGTDVYLFYDPTRFKGDSITSGTIYSDYPGNNIDTQQGKITVTGLASISQAFTGSGTLATINFTVLDNAPTGSTQVKFDFDPMNKGKTTDSNVVERGSAVADILNSVTDGNYVVGTGACGSSTTPSIGGPDSSSSSTLVTAPPKVIVTNPPVVITQLPQGGSAETTLILSIIGGLLTVAGIIGLALL